MPAPYTGDANAAPWLCLDDRTNSLGACHCREAAPIRQSVSEFHAGEEGQPEVAGLTKQVTRIRRQRNEGYGVLCPEVRPPRLSCLKFPNRHVVSLKARHS